MIAGALDFRVDNANLTPVLDADRLRSNAADRVRTVEAVKPRNATVRLVKGKPKVIPAVDGTTVTAASLKAAVEPVLTKPKGEREVEVELTGAKAQVLHR